MDIKDLLGIDFDDKGLRETIDSVTDNFVEQEAVHQYIGMAILKDCGLFGDEKVDANKVIKDIVCNDDRTMNMLMFYASRHNWFMERLEG